MDNKKYIARWAANNSTYGEFTGNNLKTMRKEARAITKGNTFANNTGWWRIDYNDGNIHEYPIVRGKV